MHVVLTSATQTQQFVAPERSGEEESDVFSDIRKYLGPVEG